MIAPDILLTVVLTSVIQSLFGVGVLLFGTPLLLLLGYDFIHALTILLPISIAINGLQIVSHYRHIDSVFYRHVLCYTIPFVVLFLFLVTTMRINITLLIGVFLILVALKNYAVAIDSALSRLFKFEKLYLIAMGIIHGLTNLGGSLLTAIVHGKAYPKDVTRVTVAVCYATFALFQIATLLLSVQDLSIPYAEHAIYLVVGAWIFILAEEMVYIKLDNEKYSKIFALFLLASGVALVLKTL